MYDGKKRYLLAVNVMAASVLRGLVEKALADLLTFFRINVDGNGNDTAAVEPSNRSLPGECCQGDKDDEREHSSRSRSSSDGGRADERATTGIEVEQQASELHPQEKEACAAGPLVFKVIFVVVRQGTSWVHPRVFLCGCGSCGRIGYLVCLLLAVNRTSRTAITLLSLFSSCSFVSDISLRKIG